jgi:mannose-6-phosphate isomerase-like protein (cupin superfamily)
VVRNRRPKGLRSGSPERSASIRCSTRLCLGALPARASRSSPAWHTHPLGQTLIVTSGVGRAQQWGGPVEEIRPGDVVWFPPGEKHWHGAAPTTAMTHIAIQEKLDGKPVDWLEHVTPEQYEERSDAS